MSTEPLPAVSDPLATLPAEVADRMRSFHPIELPADRWLQLRPQAWALVSAAEPDTRKAAKELLSTLCSFLVRIAPDPAHDAARLHDMLDDAAVTRYLAIREREGTAQKTRQNHRGRLNRLLRAARGLPAHQPRGRERAASAAPYRDEEIARLLQASSAAPQPVGRALRAAVGLGIGCGLVIPHAYGAALTPSGDAVAVRAASGLLIRPRSRWATWVARQDLAALTRESWTAARRWVAGQPGLPGLEADRLRSTWVVGLLTVSDIPLAVVLGDQPLNRRDLDRAVEHLPGHAVAASADALRNA